MIICVDAQAHQRCSDPLKNRSFCHTGMKSTNLTVKKNSSRKIPSFIMSAAEGNKYIRSQMHKHLDLYYSSEAKSIRFLKIKY